MESVTQKPIPFHSLVSCSGGFWQIADSECELDQNCTAIWAVTLAWSSKSPHLITCGLSRTCLTLTRKSSLNCFFYRAVSAEVALSFNLILYHILLVRHLQCVCCFFITAGQKCLLKKKKKKSEYKLLLLLPSIHGRRERQEEHFTLN